MGNIPKEIKRVDEVTWEIPTSYKEGMNVPARIIATEKLIKEMDMGVYDQITNVATLPGIQKYALCMPDGHWGYGFPIGGVAAFDPEEGGVISPGGVGFDINCGMSLIKTNLTEKDLEQHKKEILNKLFDRVPAGVGSSGFVKLSHSEFKKVVEEGSKWCVDNGYGWDKDLTFTEEDGCIEGADSSKISDKVIKRGLNQIGTLGSGNHYLEVQVVKEENIKDKEIAKKLGFFPGQIVIMWHCGSRGAGHQIATDYLIEFLNVMESKYKIKILDRELACAPFHSPEGQNYFAAMKCGINMSFANRQVIGHRVREVFSQVFKQDAESLGMDLVYSVAHNTAKLEKHNVDGKIKELIIHRKGSTRSFSPGREEIPKAHRDFGQVVIIGGSMMTGSYVLVGTDEAMKKTFGSSAHGSGRTMSKKKKKRMFRGERVQKEMEKMGILVKSVSMSGLAEESGPSYKDIDMVINATDLAGISKPIVKLLPLLNIKG